MIFSSTLVAKINHVYRNGSAKQKLSRLGSNQQPSDDHPHNQFAISYESNSQTRHRLRHRRLVGLNNIRVSIVALVRCCCHLSRWLSPTFTLLLDHMQNDRISPAGHETWQKILWKKQSFPDNYVPPSFLSSLRRNSEQIVLSSPDGLKQSPKPTLGNIIINPYYGQSSQ